MDTKLFTFSKNDDNGITHGAEGERPTRITGGVSIPKCLQSYRFNPENNTNYKRFQNLVIPVGLSMNKNADDEYSLLDDNNDNHYSVIDSKCFETLLFSVGKDLGSSRQKLNSNKTKKRILAKNRIA